MSAFARGAAGWIRMRRDGLLPGPEIKATEHEVDAFVRSLVSKGVTEERAREIAAEQQTKTFNRARSGARR